jgi:hypothetical protein
MINGYPQSISTKILQEFEFGHQEADRDDLLDECFCDTAPVRGFLKGNKDFLLGVKGTGKSSVFRQLVSKNIKFDNKNNLNQIIVPIDQQIDYVAVKEHLLSALDSVISDEDIRMRFVWEIYILYRIVITVKESNIQISDDDLAVVSPIIEYFSFETTKPSIIDIFTKANRTIGVKLDISQTGLPAPDFYLKSEPQSSSQADREDVRTVTLNLSKIQSMINSILRKSNSIIFVLIDNLDDFLAREAYDAQKLVIQGLLSCAKDYSRHTYINVKAFLRNEVFNKADFEKIGGAEKIKPNAIDLMWSDQDIRRFMAMRFAYNVNRLLNIEKISLPYSEGDLRRQTIFSKYCPKILIRLFRVDSHQTVDVTERDYVCRKLLTVFLPREVQHYDSKGDNVNGLDVFQFIETHFCLANSRTTPRSIVIYFDKLHQITESYYEERFFPDLELNGDGEYELFLKPHLQRAYGELQLQLASYISSAVTHPEWKDRISSLLSNIRRKKSFSFRELKKLINYDDSDQDAKELLAFLEHLGVLICENKSVHLPDRSYSIPLLLQHNWVNEKGNFV